MSSLPESYPRFTREIVTPDSALLDSIAGRWTAAVEKELGKNPALSALIVFSIFALSTWGLSRFVTAQTLMVSFGCTAGAVLGIVFYRRSRRSRHVLAARIAKLKSAPRAIRHTLDLGGPHRLDFHEHGILVLVPLAPDRTFCHDISSCADHPLDPIIENACREKTLKTRWVWYDIVSASGETFPLEGFTMEGESLNPQIREDNESPGETEAMIDLFGDEWLPADYVAKIDFDKILALTAAQSEARAKESAPASNSG